VFQRTQAFPLGQRAPHSTFPTHHRLWDTTRRSSWCQMWGGTQFTSNTPADLFQSIHPYKIPPVVAWTVSQIREACIGWPCAPVY